MKETPGLSLRLAAAQRLQSVLKGGQFAPFVVSEIGDGRDRALANRLVTTALRRHGHLNLVLQRYLERGMPKKSGSFEAVLRLSLAQLLYLPELGEHSALFLAVEATKRDKQSQHLSKLMNAVLRKAQGEADLLRTAPAELLFPERLRDIWSRAYGAEALPVFGAALLEGAPLDLTLKAADAGLVAELGGVPLLGHTVRVAERDRTVEHLPGFAEGRWWVQDAASALPARLLSLPAGARVLDIGAAPGGKTAQLAAAGYEVTALDVDAERLDRLGANMRRLGFAPEIVVADGADYAPAAPFDAVLLDAPCSATGTFRRHPEVVWHRDAADIAGRVALQRRLLRNAASCLKSGGVLVYCVCSLEPEEGEGQAAWIGSALPELMAEPVAAAELAGLEQAVRPDGTLRTHPAMRVPGDNNGTLDGFFIARFRRR